MLDHRICEFGATVKQVLAIVDDKHQASRAQKSHQLVQVLPFQFHSKSEHLSGRWDYQIGLAQGTQIDNEDTVQVVTGAESGHFERQTGLTGATWSNDRKQCRRS
jgi:hypothetical protein